MNEIQDVKEVLDPERFAERVKQNPKRVYIFLLFTDEHEDFRSFIQKSWRTLNVLSGECCDIFTLEKWQYPHERFKSRLYLPVDGGSTGRARITQGDPFGFFGQDIAIDNGIMMPDLTECFRVRDTLFERPVDVVLPGFVVFPSVKGKKARYYKCGDLKANELSELFQIVLTTIRTAYNEGTTSSQVFERFVKAERIRAIKKYAVDAILKTPIMDLLKLLGHGFRLVLPKTKNRRFD